MIPRALLLLAFVAFAASATADAATPPAVEPLQSIAADLSPELEGEEESWVGAPVSGHYTRPVRSARSCGTGSQTKGGPPLPPPEA